MKKIILFDIDATLSDADRRRNLIIRTIQKLAKISKGNARDIYYQVLQKYIDKVGGLEPNSFSMSLAETLGNKKLTKKFLQMFAGMRHEKFIFPKTKQVLKKLAEKYILGIESTGGHDYQLEKLRSIIHFFDKSYIYILPEKKKKLIKKIKGFAHNVIIIDDRPDFVEYWLKHNLNVIHINQGIYAQNKDRYKIKRSVNSLSELIPMLM